jgi:hypothetical protein
MSLSQDLSALPSDAGLSAATPEEAAPYLSADSPAQIVAAQRVHRKGSYLFDNPGLL